MNPIFQIVYFIWLASEILINRIFKSKSTDKKGDKNSLVIIWIALVLATTVALYVSMRYYLPIFSNDLFRWIGIVLVAAGVFFRIIAIMQLGKYFTVDVTIREGHRLMKDGFYKFLRHPSYFASLISFIGFGISLNSWLSLLIVFVTVLTVFIMRIKIEEKVLLQEFGSEYIEYKKTTKGIIPFIY